MAKPDKPAGSDNHPFQITFVIGGDDVNVQVKPYDEVGAALEKALKKSQNTGQPVEKWEVKTEAGAAIALGATFASLGIGAGTTLFATLTAGAAG